MLTYHNTVETIAHLLKGGDIQTPFIECKITLYERGKIESQSVGGISWNVDTLEFSIWEHRDPSRRRTDDLNKILDALRKDILKKA